MFKIKNLRANTVNKNSNLSPVPHNISKNININARNDIKVMVQDKDCRKTQNLYQIKLLSKNNKGDKNNKQKNNIVAKNGENDDRGKNIIRIRRQDAKIQLNKQPNLRETKINSNNIKNKSRNIFRPNSNQPLVNFQAQQRGTYKKQLDKIQNHVLECKQVLQTTNKIKVEQIQMNQNFQKQPNLNPQFYQQKNIANTNQCLQNKSNNQKQYKNAYSKSTEEQQIKYKKQVGDKKNSQQQRQQLQNQKRQQRIRRKKKQEEEQLKRLQQTQKQIQKILQRRKQREIQRLKAKKAEQQREKYLNSIRQMQGKDINFQNNSVSGLMSTNDPLSHFQFSDLIMDIQIQKIIKTSFNHFPSGQQIEAQKAQLERINESYMMIKDDKNNKLAAGLRNFRVQIFNRIGQLIVKDQKQGFESINFRVIKADGNSRKINNQVQLTRGIPKNKIAQVIKSTKCSAISECYICLQQINIGEQCRILKCNHTFHISCSQSWVQSTASCPTCRKNLKFQ